MVEESTQTEETPETETPKRVIRLSMDELDELWAERTKRLVEELGLTKVDKAHGVFPGVEDGDNEEAPRMERVGKFFQAAILGVGIDAAMQKTLSEGTATAGGYMVPDDFRAEVIKRVNELAQLYPRVFKLSTIRDSLKIPNLGTDVEVSWDESENADFDESDPVLGQTTFTIRRMNAISTQSRELFNDSAVNVVMFLTELFSDAVSRERDKVIAIGNTSSGQPQGIYSATITQSVSVGGSLTFAKLVDIETELATQYRPGASWIMHKTNVGRVRKLTDDNGQPIFNRDAPRGAAGTLLGYPILFSDNLPTTHIYLGDLNKYWWVDREQMGFESTTTGGDTFKKHQLSMKLWERVDGKIVLVAAFAMADGITS